MLISTLIYNVIFIFALRDISLLEETLREEGRKSASKLFRLEKRVDELEKSE